MADGNLFSNIKDEFFRYVGVTSIFPEATELLTLERNLKMVNVQVSGMSKNLSGLGKEGTTTFRNLKSSAKDYGGEIDSVVKRTADLQDAMSWQSVIMGVSMDTMVTLTNASANYGRVLSSETSAAMAMFAEATGVSEYTLGQFSARMIASGRIQEKEARSFLTNILSVREQYSFATEDLTQLFSITEKYAKILNVTGARLKTASGDMAKFIAVIKQTGLEADFATELLEKMIDPVRAQENMVLLSKLGISMRDISFGTPMEDFTKTLPALKKIANDILSTPGRVVQAKMADVYGLTLEQVTMLSQMEINRAQTSREKTLEVYRKESQTAVETLENFKNSIFGIVSIGFNHTIGLMVRALGPFSILFAGTLLKPLKKMVGFINEKLFGDVRASLTTSISSGVSDGIIEGLNESESRLVDYLREVKGLTPGANREGTLGGDITASKEKILGGESFGASFTGAKIDVAERRAQRREKRVDYSGIEEEIRAKVEETRASILSIETEMESMKSRVASSREGQAAIDEWVAELTVLQEMEKNKYEILANSAEGRSLILDNIETTGTEYYKILEESKELTERISRHEARQAKIKEQIENASGKRQTELYKELDMVNDFISVAGEKNEKLKEAIEKNKTNLESLTGAVGADVDVGATFSSNRGKKAEEVGKALRDIVDGSITAGTASNIEALNSFNNIKTSIDGGVATATEKIGKGIGAIGKILNKIDSKTINMLPGMGGALGKISGILGGPLGISVAGIASITGAMFGLARKTAKKNKETERHEEIILSEVARIKEGVLDTLGKPLSGLYSKVAKYIAEKIEVDEPIKNLENMTRAYITEEKLENGETIALIREIGKKVAITTDLNDEMNRKQTVMAYGAINKG